MAESTAAEMALTCLKSMSSLENENVDTTASDIIDVASNIIDVASSDPTTSSSDTIDNIGSTDESDEITEAALPVQQQHPTTGLTCRRSRKNITIATKSTIRDQNLEKEYKAASIQQHIDDQLFLDIPQPSKSAMRLTTGFSSGRASKARKPANPPKSLTVVPLPYKQDDTFSHAAQEAQTYKTTARTTGPGSGKQWSAAQTTLLEKDHELSQVCFEYLKYLPYTDTERERRNAESTGDRKDVSRPYGYIGMKREGTLWLGEDDRESEEECSSSTAKASAEGHWSDGSVPDLVAGDGSSPPSSPSECGELDGAEQQGWREVGQRIKEAYEHNKEQPTMPKPTEPHWTDGSVQEPSDPHWAHGSYPSPNARQPRPTYYLPTGFDAYLDLEEGDHWVSAEASGPPHSLLYIKFRGLAMAEDAARASSGAWAEADAWELDRRLAEAHRLRRGRACDEATGA
ncbi:hypothetical protein LTR15_005336 [Elasticomyces elasticus]|nr:hypothetical protein LTR15_005336 [Elasticomyces elasticus]